MFALTGKTIIITGAAGSIGSETARLCGALGASLILTDLREPEAIAAELMAKGVEVRTIAADVTKRSAMEDLVASVDRIDAIVANAGYCPWDDWEEDGWDATFDKVIDINLKGTLHLTRAGMAKMAKAGSGRIIIVTSTAGRMGGVRSSPHYVAAKGGLVSFIKWAARKAAPHGILVNGVAPGPTVTNMTDGQVFDTNAIPLGRMGNPTEIAGPIAFLCGPASSYMCGAILDVNGGVYMN